MSELMSYACITWNGEGSIMAWLSDFARNCRDIIEGKSKRWSLKRVEIDSDDIVLRYSDGKTSGDVVLEDFAGKATFGLPMAYNSSHKRAVTVSTSIDDQGGRVVEIKTPILPDVWTTDGQCASFYDFCKIIKLMLVQNSEAGTVNLMRLYEFFQPHGRKVELLTDDTLRKLLDGDAMLLAPDGYRAIRL